MNPEILIINNSDPNSHNPSHNSIYEDNNLQPHCRNRSTYSMCSLSVNENNNTGIPVKLPDVSNNNNHGNNNNGVSVPRTACKNSKCLQKHASTTSNKPIDSTCDCHNHDYPPWTGEIHGMSQALLSKSTPLRVFWWIVLVLCTSCGTATTVLVVIEYMGHQTATSTTIRLVPYLEIPAITVCPKIPDAFKFEEMYHDMKISLPDLRRDTALDLMRFWLGGSGLENMDDLPEFNKTYLDMISGLYDTWSTGYDAQTFFDLMHAKYGFKCTDLFHLCELGGKPRDCCKTLFRRRAVMRRGICYQTLRNVNQTEADDIGRLVLALKAPPSITSPQYNFVQPQIIIYINDNFEQVLDFPRFYLYPHEWNRMHFTARLVELLDSGYHPDDCTDKLIGKDANCFVRNWLNTNIIDPYNCTVPYLSGVEGLPQIPTCKPYTIASEYYNAIQLVHSGSVHSHQCLPGCTRWEYSVSLQQSPSLSPFMGYVFNLEVSFYDLQYEHVKEVLTTSVPGFMSQIGGQFGFFLGLSIITMIQIAIYFITYVFNSVMKFIHTTSVRVVNWGRKTRKDTNLSPTDAEQHQQEHQNNIPMAGLDNRGAMITPTLSHHSIVSAYGIPMKNFSIAEEINNVGIVGMSIVESKRNLSRQMNIDEEEDTAI